MRVTNMYPTPVSVKLLKENGSVDFVYAQPKSKITLPPAVTIDPNWWAEHPNVKLVPETEQAPAQ